jgi:hypothetical protein
VDGGQHRPGRSQRLQAPCDVGAVGSPEAGLGEEQREPRADPDVAPGARERAQDDALPLVHGLQRREGVDDAQVVVVDDKMAPRRDRGPQAPQDGDGIGHVQEEQARVDQVERRAGDRLVGLEVERGERALAMARPEQHVHRLRAEGGVDVDADDLAGRADALGEVAHGPPRSRARVKTAGAACELDVVEQPSCGLLPDAGLRPEALVLRVRASQHVAVGVGGRHARHRPRRGVRGASWTRPRSLRCEVDARRRATYGRGMRDALLDRDAELAALADRLEQVRAGTGRVIVVEGAAGIGKSSLLAAAGRSAEAQGATVLSARAGPLEQDAAWGVARQLFAPLQCEPAWGELTRGAAGLAGRVLHPETPEPALTGDAMHAAAHGLEYLAANLADRAPTVLVVDDVHWADAPSLRWLAQLAGRLEELRLAVVCAVRSGEPPSQPDLLAELLAAAPEGPLRPRALGPAAAEALVRRGCRRPARASRTRAMPSPPGTRSCSARSSVSSPPSRSPRPTRWPPG